MRLSNMGNGFYQVSNGSITMLGRDKEELKQRYVKYMDDLRIRIGANPNPITVDDIIDEEEEAKENKKLLENALKNAEYWKNQYYRKEKEYNVSTEMIHILGKELNKHGVDYLKILKEKFEKVI